MAFKDTFPLEIEFEIDRGKLVRYYRDSALYGCALLLIPLGLVLSSAFVQSYLIARPQLNFVERAFAVLGFTAAGIVAACIVSATFYFVYFRRSSELAAQNLRLRVEGPYLRVVSGNYFITDRRYHFKDIHGYSIQHGPLLRRYGLKSLSFQVSIRHTPPVHLEGLVDIETVRDTLCELDAARERV